MTLRCALFRLKPELAQLAQLHERLPMLNEGLCWLRFARGSSLFGAIPAVDKLVRGLLNI